MVLQRSIDGCTAENNELKNKIAEIQETMKQLMQENKALIEFHKNAGNDIPIM
jgi:FtsZ-binding cell division protein ZapB